MTAKMTKGVQKSSRWKTAPRKHIPLAFLVVQNAAVVLLMHYSRVMPLVAGHRYLTSTAVLLNEVIKLAISLTFTLYEISRTLSPSTPATSLFEALIRTVFFTGDSWKLAIPACLYTLSNSLQYVAISNLDAATFQVTYQLKLATTALFGALVLGKALSLRRILAIVLLIVGVAIAQLPGRSDSEIDNGNASHGVPRSLGHIMGLGNFGVRNWTKRSATYEGIQEDQALVHPRVNTLLGLSAAVVGCLASGLAGVFLEKIFKESNTRASVWIRNVQLSFYSLFPALCIGVAFAEGAEVAKNGFFDGYNWIVWLSIILQSLGGILVALSLNFTDTVTKNFASTISVVVSLFGCMVLFGFDPNNYFLFGLSITFFATYVYTGGSERPKPPGLRIQKFEPPSFDEPSRNGDFSIKLPVTPLKMEALTTSRPASPMRHHNRKNSNKEYFIERRDA